MKRNLKKRSSDAVPGKALTQVFKDLIKNPLKSKSVLGWFKSTVKPYGLTAKTEECKCFKYVCFESGDERLTLWLFRGAKCYYIIHTVLTRKVKTMCVIANSGYVVSRRSIKRFTLPGPGRKQKLALWLEDFYHMHALMFSSLPISSSEYFESVRKYNAQKDWIEEYIETRVVSDRLITWKLYKDVLRIKRDNGLEICYLINSEYADSIKIF